MPAILQSPGTAGAAEQFNSYSDRRHLLGTKLMTHDGRVFRFGENDGALEVVGTLYQSEVPNAADDAIAVQAVAAIGAKSISLTSNAEAIVVNEFDGGYFIPEDDAGEGYVYLVDNTPAGAATSTVSLTLATGLEVAITTATTVMLLKHPGKEVIIHSSPPTAPPYGVAASAIAASEFGWYQIGGMAALRKTGTLIIAESFQGHATVDGAIEPDTAGNPAMLGIVMHVGVADTEHAKVVLAIA